jgi:PhoH-like ATPase
MPPKHAAASAQPVKHYILDTNVLIHDPASPFSFKNNIVWIPVEVFEELDRFKSESSTRGANAREVHRRLSERFMNPSDMQAGVKLENGGMLRVCVNPVARFDGEGWHLVSESPRFQALRDLFADMTSPDNRILAAACGVADHERAPVILVTKDLNMMLKARALGLAAQDYRTDRVEDVDIRLTMRRSEEEYETLDVPPHTLQAYASQEAMVLQKAANHVQNHYLLLRNEEEPTHAIPARHVGGGEMHKLRRDRISIRGGRALAALNLGQRFLLDALYDPAITLVTVYGKAGTGKTLLSVGAALEQVQTGIFEKMLITRVIMPTGRDIGFLPGKLEEKMQPWVQPAFDALELLLTRPRRPEQFENKRQSQRKSDDQQAHQQHGASPPNGPAKPMRPWEPLLASGRLEVEAITHIRGRSIPNAVFIVDEAQQLTPHEAKTLITRMGKGSKMILIGDLGQIDNPYVDAHTNGLVYARNRLQGQPWMAHINLFKGERSEMAEVAANLM